MVAGFLRRVKKNQADVCPQFFFFFLGTASFQQRNGTMNTWMISLWESFFTSDGMNNDEHELKLTLAQLWWDQRAEP